ncbi:MULTISPECIES: hypothetical protein [Haloarcula]|uniref:hypothetical protein n=1 Tax=Haloarcula TaxID=2237 RepID=UPI0006780B03|nr:hypothetical protein [Haloarcula amylolytica]
MIYVKNSTQEVVACLLATVAGTLLPTVTTPLMMWTDAHWYANKESPMPGIQSGEGYVSILTAFAYVAVFTVLVRGITFLSAGGETVHDSPSAGVDGDGSATGTLPEPTPNLTATLNLPPTEKENKETDLNNETQNDE